jgi:hypothetical protein
MESEMNDLYLKIKKTQAELKNILDILPEAVMIFDKEAKALKYANYSTLKLQAFDEGIIK